MQRKAQVIPIERFYDKLPRSDGVFKHNLLQARCPDSPSSLSEWRCGFPGYGPRDSFWRIALGLISFIRKLTMYLSPGPP